MIRLGEKPFLSIQGEGNRTGVLTVFVRLFGCNLNCHAFGQKEPTNPSSWILPYKNIDAKAFSKVEDLPVFEYGCDSSYSWASKFKHLALDYDNASQINDEIYQLLPNGVYFNSHTMNDIDICFTGGEPMLHQPKLLEILQNTKSIPKTVQVETNGTQSLNKNHWPVLSELFDINWNISPKLYHVSGEVDAVKPEVIKNLYNLNSNGCLKFVVNNEENTWKELHDHVKNIRSEGVYFPIYVMPVGATSDSQKDTAVLSEIAKRAIGEGYHLSSRLQSIFFSNKVGT